MLSQPISVGAAAPEHVERVVESRRGVYRGGLVAGFDRRRHNLVARITPLAILQRLGAGTNLTRFRGIELGIQPTKTRQVCDVFTVLDLILSGRLGNELGLVLLLILLAGKGPKEALGGVLERSDGGVVAHRVLIYLFAFHRFPLLLLLELSFSQLPLSGLHLLVEKVLESFLEALISFLFFSPARFSHISLGSRPGGLIAIFLIALFSPPALLEEGLAARSDARSFPEFASFATENGGLSGHRKLGAIGATTIERFPHTIILHGIVTLDGIDLR